MGLNLLSMNALDRNNIYNVFRNGFCDIFDTDSDALLGNGFKRSDGLYQIRGLALTGTDESNKVCLNAVQTTHTVLNGINSLHKRFGHTGKESIEEMARKSIVPGIDQESESSTIRCIPCAEGKQTRSSMKRILTEESTEVGDIIVTDLCGPMPVESWSKGKYCITFIDAKSRYTAVSILRTKETTEVLDTFTKFHAMFELQYNAKVKRLHSDNGGKYCSRRFPEYCSNNGILRTFTAPYNPESNGIGERMNRTLMEKVRRMLTEAKLSPKFWAEAINHAVYLQNTLKTSAHGSTPLEFFKAASQMSVI